MEISDIDCFIVRVEMIIDCLESLDYEMAQSIVSNDSALLPIQIFYSAHVNNKLVQLYMIKLTGALTKSLPVNTPFIKFMLDSFIEIVADNADKDNIVIGAIKSFIATQKKQSSQLAIEYLLAQHWAFVSTLPKLFAKWTSPEIEVIDVSSPTHNINDSDEEIMFAPNYKMDFD